VEDLPEVQHSVEEGVLGPGLAIKTHTKNPHKKKQKNPPKMFFFGFFVFLGFLNFFYFL
jgi:hypothetical protein